VFFILLGLAASCGNEYAPKPRGYFRIKFPEKEYHTYHAGCHFTFDYPTYAKIERDTSAQSRRCWMDVVFPSFNGRLHLSYYPVTSKKILNELIEDARTFAFKHTVKATSIDESLIFFPQENMHGILYTIEGNSASAAQFFLTDSVSHYIRGALYFHEKPRLDSIQPVLDFLREDINVMIKSMRWK